jgi:phosphoribosylglycinamide formyltransferase 1
VTAVISNKPDAKGLLLAQAQGVNTAVVDHQAFAHEAEPRAAFDAALMARN